MKGKIVKEVLETLGELIPLGVYQRLFPQSSLDFFYHIVSDQNLPHIKYLYPIVPIDDFKQALDYITSHFNVINYNQLSEHILNGRSLPPSAVHLSFDDGYVECFSIVRPILLERGIPCTFFLTTELLDNQKLFFRNKISLCIDKILASSQSDVLKVRDLIRNKYQIQIETKHELMEWLKSLRKPDEEKIDGVCELLGLDAARYLRDAKPYLSNKQVQQMVNEGFTIGAHTKTHRKLGDLTPIEINEEIVDSCELIRNLTGQSEVPLSFPHSGARLDRNLLSRIRKENPTIGLFFDTKGIRKDSPFIVNRIWAERPIIKHGEIEPLPAVLKRAYRDQWMEESMRRMRLFLRR